jgi:4-hydroxy-tetrahydrodipicolinate reductase
MKIALIGYGKMGKEIEKIAISRGHHVGYKIDIDNEADINNITPSNSDVVIEFTSPHSAFANVSKCLNNKVNVVCGSTGWNDQLSEAKKLALDNRIGFLWSSNFSIGVNVFFKINQQLAKIMNDIEGYEPSITEIHHIHKKDAPSGTAITLAEGLLSNYRKKDTWKLKPDAGKRDISITAIREDEVPGTHVIKYDSDVDYIEISHIAKNRLGLALGAIIAAEYLNGKSGIFDMNDVLGF